MAKEPSFLGLERNGDFDSVVFWATDPTRYPKSQGRPGRDDLRIPLLHLEPRSAQASETHRNVMENPQLESGSDENMPHCCSCFKQVCYWLGFLLLVVLVSLSQSQAAVLEVVGWSEDLFTPWLYPTENATCPHLRLHRLINNGRGQVNESIVGGGFSGVDETTRIISSSPAVVASLLPRFQHPQYGDTCYIVAVVNALTASYNFQLQAKGVPSNRFVEFDAIELFVKAFELFDLRPLGEGIQFAPAIFRRGWESWQNKTDYIPHGAFAKWPVELVRKMGGLTDRFLDSLSVVDQDRCQHSGGFPWWLCVERDPSVCDPAGGSFRSFTPRIWPVTMLTQLWNSDGWPPYVDGEQRMKHCFERGKRIGEYLVVFIDAHPLQNDQCLTYTEAGDTIFAEYDPDVPGCGRFYLAEPGPHTVMIEDLITEEKAGGVSQMYWVIRNSWNRKRTHIKVPYGRNALWISTFVVSISVDVPEAEIMAKLESDVI